MRPTGSRWLWWLLVVGAASYFSIFVFYPRWYLAVGTNHFGVWFLDNYAILASNDAVSIGRDPWVPNPLDPLNRQHVYSHWWLHLRDFGLTRADNLPVGFVIVAAFFVTAAARLRPREPRELLWSFAVLCSSPILLATNRANNDLVIFLVLAPIVPCLCSRRAWLRLVPVLLIAIAAGLKFYPAIAAPILLAGAAGRERRWRVMGAALVIGAVVLNVAPDYARIKNFLPKAEGLMTMGAANLFEAIGCGVGVAKLASLALGAVAAVAAARTKIFSGWVIAEEDRTEWWSFVLGALLLTGCFFAGTNFAYRWVFALWLAPLLWRLPRDERAPEPVRRLARWTGGLFLAVLWLDPGATIILTTLVGRVPGGMLMRAADRFFAWEQPVTWAFFGCLLAFLVRFVIGELRRVPDRV